MVAALDQPSDGGVHRWPAERLGGHQRLRVAGMVEQILQAVLAVLGAGAAGVGGVVGIEVHVVAREDAGLPVGIGGRPRVEIPERGRVRLAVDAAGGDLVAIAVAEAAVAAPPGLGALHAHAAIAGRRRVVALVEIVDRVGRQVLEHRLVAERAEEQLDLPAIPGVLHGSDLLIADRIRRRARGDVVGLAGQRLVDADRPGAEAGSRGDV